MSLPPASEGATEDTSPCEPTEMGLEKRRLLLGQIVWVAVAAWSLGVLAASLPLSFHQWQTACRGTACSALQLTPAQAQTLQTALGLSLGTYAVVALAVTCVSAVCWVGVGVLLWRKLGQGIVLVVALQAITQGVLGANAFAANGLGAVLAQAHSSWQVPGLLLLGVNQLLFFFVFALFPTGRFVPRWMRWGAGLWTVLYLLYFAGRLSPALESSLPPFVPVFLGVIVLLVLAQVYRYRRVSTPVERQQTKWVLFAFIILNLAQLGLLIPEFVLAPLHQSGSLYGPIVNLLIILVYLVAPAAIILAIQRYRLWDVDTLVQKALVYGMLTVLLAVTYACLIIGLESLVGLFTKHVSDPVVLVISTLAIAALFQPLRTRIQALIDRRFYRRKYDAEKTLAAFSATLRNEVDLNDLCGQVLAVVEETMQPVQVSLWLRPPDRHVEEQAHGPEPRQPVSPTRLSG